MSIIELSKTAHHMRHVLNTLHMFGCADHPFAEDIDVYERALQDYPKLLKTLLLEDARDLTELANSCNAFINEKERGKMSKQISCKKCRYFRRGITCFFCGLHYYGLSFYDICDDYKPRKGVEQVHNLVDNESDAL